jgi:hypothetical protein
VRDNATTPTKQSQSQQKILYSYIVPSCRRSPTFWISYVRLRIKLTRRHHRSAKRQRASYDNIYLSCESSETVEHRSTASTARVEIVSGRERGFGARVEIDQNLVHSPQHSARTDIVVQIDRLTDRLFDSLRLTRAPAASPMTSWSKSVNLTNLYCST